MVTARRRGPTRSLLYNRSLQHTLFWIAAAIVLGVSVLGSYRGAPFGLPGYAARLAVHLLVIAGVVYLNLRVLIPRLWKQDQAELYLLALFAGTVAGAVGIALMYRFVLVHFTTLQPYGRFNPVALFVFFIQTNILVGAASLLHFMKDWLVLKDKALQLTVMEKEKLEAELLALRAQLNPHFLFNSLNNIYALTLARSDRTPELIIKLSNLMRYILYECRGTRVRLEQELAFVRDYLDLEQVRVGEDVAIRLETSGAVDSQPIAPLLFLTLIENAFKHGARTPGSFIHLHLHVDADDRLTFTAENALASRPEEGVVDEPDLYHGVGLANLRERLSRLYPGRHTLTTEEAATYRTTLHLDLDGHIAHGTDDGEPPHARPAGSEAADGRPTGSEDGDGHPADAMEVLR